MRGPSKANPASVSSLGLRQRDPKADGGPPVKCLASAVSVESPGPSPHNRTQRLQTLQLIHVQLRGAQSLGAKIQSNFEGLKTAQAPTGLANLMPPISGVTVLRLYADAIVTHSIAGKRELSAITYFLNQETLRV